jgi:hypothetical protein
LLIAGLGRSGSTLIDRALGQPEGCLSLGEVVRLWERGLHENARCSCDHPFRECEFWSRVGETAYGGWDSLDPGHVLALQRRVDRTRHIPLMLTGWGRRYQQTRREYVELLSRLYRGFAAVTGAQLVIDSSKDLSTTYLLRGVPDITLRVLHLVRDPRAVAYSWTKHVAKPGTAAEMDRYAPAVVAGRYLFTNLMLHLIGLFGTPRRRFRYEDFVADPATTAEEMLAFAGFGGADLGYLDGASVSLAPYHSVGGNPMRFSDGTLEIRLDDAWRSALPPRHRRIVAVVTFPLLLAYGYARGRRRP